MCLSIAKHKILWFFIKKKDGAHAFTSCGNLSCPLFPTKNSGTICRINKGQTHNIWDTAFSHYSLWILLILMVFWWRTIIYILNLLEFKMLYYCRNYCLQSAACYTAAEKIPCKAVRGFFAGKTTKTAYTGVHGHPWFFCERRFIIRVYTNTFCTAKTRQRAFIKKRCNKSCILWKQIFF